MMKVLAIIPARYASTRFPGKPLVRLGEHTMLNRVVSQVRKCSSINHIIVATEDQRIFDHAREIGVDVMMTSSEHPSGTDRCREVVENIAGTYDIAINIQGDEPFVRPQQIEDLINIFRQEVTQIATLVKPIENFEELFNPNIVKAVTNEKGEALYFSRSCVPYLRGIPEAEWLDKHLFLRHLGVYAYKTTILSELGKLKQTALERAESLEQLRWLENDYRISCVLTHFQSLAVDTPEDVNNVEKFLEQNPEYL